MINSLFDNQTIEKILKTSKTIAMVGVSSIKEEKPSSPTIRRPSIIVMKYLQEFGYKVIPVNPNAAGKEIYGEPIVFSLEDVTIPVDIVNIFRPSRETPLLARQAVKIKAKVIWLQYGIQHDETEKIANSASITYISNKCIKQEYQKIFLKMNPVFPLLQKN